MAKKPARLVRKEEIERSMRTYSQRLNPRSRIRGSWMSSIAGLSRASVDLVVLPAGSEAFAYHAHEVEEEWLYALSGRAISLVSGEETEISAGDFLGFPTPSEPHLLVNPFAEDFIYVQGGEHGKMDVIDYPLLQKRYLILRPDGAPSSFHALGPSEQPFGPLDEEK
jgi:uncharacterized cupin superfamily protein